MVPDGYQNTLFDCVGGYAHAENEGKGGDDCQLFELRVTQGCAEDIDEVQSTNAVPMRWNLVSLFPAAPAP